MRRLVQKINPIISKPFCGLGNSRTFNWLAKNYEKDPIKFVAGVSLASVVFKDSLGCYLYVKQSLNNEKIPKEKRGFVAAFDLTNGVLMIATQIATFCTVANSKVQKFLFDKTLGRFFDNKARRNCKELIKQKNKNLGKAAFNTAFKQAEMNSRAAFKLFLPLISATIIAKRMIVPFVATPIASWVKKNVLKDEDSAELNSAIHSNILDYTSLSEIYQQLQKQFATRPHENLKN